MIKNIWNWKYLVTDKKSNWKEVNYIINSSDMAFINSLK